MQSSTMKPQAPNPQATAPACSCSQGLRRIHCAHYNRCLDRAVEKKWPDFSCCACNAYVAVLNDLEYWRAEAGGCAELLYEIYREPEQP
jgi:hypothetical protein